MIVQTMEHLATANSVGVLYLKGEHEPEIDVGLARKLAFVEAFQRRDPDRGITDLTVIAESLLCGTPTWVKRTWNLEMYRRVRDLVQCWRPHVLQAEYHVMGQYFPAVPGTETARVLVEHEPGVLSIEHRLRSCRGLKRAGMYANFLGWKRFEPHILAMADAVVVFTEADRSYVNSLCPSASVWPIRFGTDLPTSYSTAGAGQKKVLFVGNFMHYPNRNSVERLLDKIYPELARRIPDVKLQLVGENPTDRMRSARGRNIEITGYVPDLTPYLREADVFVAPLSVGGGMRVKMAQAFAHGKAVVATELAVTGMDVRTGEHYLQAETDEEFVVALTRLLESEQERNRLGSRARQAVASTLTWAESVNRYREMYDHITAMNRFPHDAG